MTASLRRSILAFYAAPAFVLALPTIPAYVLLPSFYADSLGLGLSATGAALLIARLFDVAVDLPVGILSDMRRWRLTRYKPMIALGAVIAAIALYRIFAPGAAPSPAYLTLWAACLYLGWTMVQLPYLAWGARLSADYRTRSVVTGWREAIGLIGTLGAAAVPALIAVADMTAREGYPVFAVVVIALGAPAMAGLLLKVPEPVDQGESGHVPLRTLTRNGLFLRLLSAWFVNGLANGIPAVLFPLFTIYVLRTSELEMGLLLAAYFVSGVVCAPLWVSLVGRVDKHRLWCIGMAIACAAFIFVPLLGAGDLVPFLIICLVSGATLGADLALPPAMQADVIDWDRYLFGSARGGTLFALWNMATKLALALAVGLSFPLAEAFGFQPQSDNTPSALLALALIYSALPVVLKLCAMALVWPFPLTRSAHAAVQRRLNARST